MAGAKAMDLLKALYRAFRSATLAVALLLLLAVLALFATLVPQGGEPRPTTIVSRVS